MEKSVRKLKFPLRGKYVAMLAPSFVVDFSYPKIISQLKDLGFDKIVELTFGAKMINRDYHKKLKNSDKLIISSVCPGIVETIKSKYPHCMKNLICVDSPMVATAKITKKIYPRHKIVFFSPCNFKKIEAEKSGYVDYVLNYQELASILGKNNGDKRQIFFDRFYNDYTKIYPLSGGLFKTAHLKKILNKNEAIILDGIDKVVKFLEKPKLNVKFLDVTFCEGGCIGGPNIISKLPLKSRKKKVLDYMNLARKECIPESSKGIVKEATGISFRSCYSNK